MFKLRFVSVAVVVVLAMAAWFAGSARSAGPQGVEVPRKQVVGFVQAGSESDWRNAMTISVKDEAKKRGYDLVFLDANGKVDAQREYVGTLIKQAVDAIVISPVVADGWDDVLRTARAVGIPVFITDRAITAPAELYTASIVMDFREEGRQAGRWLAKATGGKAVIFELEGEPGSGPANDRKAGFAEVLKEYPGMEIVKSEPANFMRARGQQVTAAFLSTPESRNCTAIFAHNDDMALGAVGAIEAAGKKPGVDIKIVSVDGIKAAMQAVVDGKINCTVECRAELGPAIFDAVDLIVRKRVNVVDRVFDGSNAKEAMAGRKY